MTDDDALRERARDVLNDWQDATDYQPTWRTDQRGRLLEEMIARAIAAGAAEARKEFTTDEDGHTVDWKQSAKAELASRLEYQQRAYELSQERRPLVEALLAFKLGEDCFCEVALDNPNMQGKHDRCCLLARAALRAAGSDRYWLTKGGPPPGPEK